MQSLLLVLLGDPLAGVPERRWSHREQSNDLHRCNRRRRLRPRSASLHRLHGKRWGKGQNHQMGLSLMDPGFSSDKAWVVTRWAAITVVGVMVLRQLPPLGWLVSVGLAAVFAVSYLWQRGGRI